MREWTGQRGGRQTGKISRMMAPRVLSNNHNRHRRNQKGVKLRVAVLSAECNATRPWSVENCPTWIEQVACHLTFLAFVPTCCGCVMSSETNAYLDQRSNTTGKFFAEVLGVPFVIFSTFHRGIWRRSVGAYGIGDRARR